MRPPRLGTLFALGACLTLVPASASAITIHRHHEKQIVKRGIGEKIPVRTVRWTEVVTVAPADSDQDGVKDSADDCPQSAGSLDNGCDPVPIVSQSTPQATGYAPPAYPTGGGGCVGMEAESGSAGYSAMSSSGYIGCYQISPDHFAAGGSCAGLGTDPAGQDQCAANICATEGAGAWTNPAGQNPCGRLGG